MAPPGVRSELLSLVPRLRRFALVLTRCPDMADDLVEAALVRALEQLDQLQFERSIDWWLFRILKSVWKSAQRRPLLRRSKFLDGQHEESNGVQFEPGAQLLEVRSMFFRLNLEQREILHLVCVENYTYNAAAEFLGIPLRSVMGRVSNARAALFLGRNFPVARQRNASSRKVRPQCSPSQTLNRSTSPMQIENGKLFAFQARLSSFGARIEQR
jgi:RNA polymerase sigma-70 factor, ECF subfamily